VPTQYRASLVLPAPAEQIFDLLADPATHRDFDASGMVGAPVDPARLARVGQVFAMAMTYRDGEQVEHYRSDNHVTVCEPPHRIAWATATEGGAPLGWFWRYDLDLTPVGTRVTLTYDWTDAPAADRRRFGVPLVTEDDLERSLRLLARICRR
jgi:uncharacterized protein YndB with AHSA1/START domain